MSAVEFYNFLMLVSYSSCWVWSLHWKQRNNSWVKDKTKAEQKQELSDTETLGAFILNRRVVQNKVILKDVYESMQKNCSLLI